MRDPSPRTGNIMVQEDFNNRAQEQWCPEKQRVGEALCGIKGP